MGKINSKNYRQGIVKEIVNIIIDNQGIGECIVNKENDVTVRGKDAMFFNYYPHVGLLDVDIHINGWIGEGDCIVVRKKFAISDRSSIKDCQEALKAVNESRFKNELIDYENKEKERWDR